MIDKNRTEKNIGEVAANNLFIPAGTAQHITGSIRKMQGDMARATARCLPAIPRMTMLDVVPPNTIKIINETLKRTQQASAITQLVGSEGAFNAGNMLQQTGALNIIQDVMRERADVINTLTLKTVIETTGLNRQIQDIAQTVGNAGAIYARDMFMASGAVDVMRNVMDNAASAAAASILDVVQSWRKQWLSSIASMAFHFRPSIHYMLCEEAYIAVLEGDREETLYFTINVCGLSDEYHPYVERALWEERWRQADDPVAYICRTASNMMKRDWTQENIWKLPRFGHILSLDEPMKGGDPIAYLLPDPRDPLKEIDDWLVIEQLLSEANLPPEAVKLLLARSLGYKRSDVGDYLGWDQQKVERVWRTTNRRIKDFREFRN